MKKKDLKDLLDFVKRDLNFIQDSYKALDNFYDEFKKATAPFIQSGSDSFDSKNYDAIYKLLYSIQTDCDDFYEKIDAKVADLFKNGDKLIGELNEQM